MTLIVLLSEPISCLLLKLSGDRWCGIKRLAVHGEVFTWGCSGGTRELVWDRDQTVTDANSVRTSSVIDGSFNRAQISDIFIITQHNQQQQQQYPATHLQRLQVLGTADLPATGHTDKLERLFCRDTWRRTQHQQQQQHPRRIFTAVKGACNQLYPAGARAPAKGRPLSLSQNAGHRDENLVGRTDVVCRRCGEVGGGRTWQRPRPRPVNRRLTTKST